MGKRMELSKYNIFGPIKNSERYYILNLLTGNADILDKRRGDEILRGEFTTVEEYAGLGYLVDPAEERALYEQRYEEFLLKRKSEEVQVFFVPWYACNFSCSYCYQSGYEVRDAGLDEEVIDGFFRYIETELRDRNKYITLFGGEPLLLGKRKELISYFIGESSRAGIDVALVTNGYNLAEYLDVLEEGRIREIQVTLDGTEKVHNRRRMLKGGAPTFSRIVEGVDRALEAGLGVNLRVVLDGDNMGELPEIARFAINRGWTKHSRFKTQLGRNYELHTCQAGSAKLFSRLEFYGELYELIQIHPEIVQFHRPAYSLSKFLLENGELPDPLFDACPACKSEWAFDFTGRIYPCTATVGKEGESVGTFHPEVKKNEEAIAQWRNRDVTTIPGCEGCPVQLVCGGGCGSLAKNREGTVFATDCRPEKELIGMGLSLYFNKEVSE